MTNSTATPAPERTLEQRRAALAEANRIRTYRAELKRDLKAGRITWLDLLHDPDAATMKVIDALLASPKLGRCKVNKALGIARVSPSKTFAGITRRQRDDLEVALRYVAPCTAPRRAAFEARTRGLAA